MYLSAKGRFSKHIDFIILDIICMEISFVIAFFVRHHNWILFDNKYYRSAMIILVVTNLVSCYIFYSMQDVLKRGRQLEFYATIKQVVLTTLFLVLYLFISKTSEDISRNVIIIFPLIYLAISFIVRLIYKSILKKFLKNKTNRQFIIITLKDRAEQLISKINSSVNDITIKGIILLDDNNVSVINEMKVVACKDNLFEYLQTEYVDEILLSVGDFDVHDILKKLSLMGIVLHVEYNGIEDIVGSNNKLIVENIADTTVVTSTINTINPLQLIIKRFMDIVFGIVGTVFTLILAILIGPIIFIKSNGPIFFVQDRVGRNGKVFKMIKFRSMYLDAEDRKKDLASQNENKDQLMFKIEHDPRIIKGIGEFIRKTSIDEFPQFINVLKGEMSVVGTRPPTLDEWNKYDLHHRARLAIKPGITGLWQVSGRSEIKDFEEVVRLDTEYIKNFSLWKDASIIYKTIKVVFSRQGAK
ncbi:MAG: sugar transferase [Lachnospiraceae bacterium]|nr:sugar transferase [Lachnospiraceae bacterium]